MAPGFVWLDEGQVVGNVSLRRAHTRGGWMIGNVAVHPDLQGEGIGRSLMDAAIDLIVRRGGSWVGLEVREDNAVACGLYRSMGFEVVGHSLEMSRSEGLAWPNVEADMHWLRRARMSDGEAIYRLALEGLGQLQREALEIRRISYRAGWEARFSARLEGRRADWWVAWEEGGLVAALCLGGRPRARYHRLTLLALQERQLELGQRLLNVGLTALSRRPRWETVVELAGGREVLEPTLTAAGFRRVRRLAQMRKLL
jgi:N-acetylglutamate synthase-like GNAT family acetyltransferase